MAWEEAFDNRKSGWGENIGDELGREGYPFIDKVLVEELKHYDLQGKTIAQFCCNNGRELLSLLKMGAESGVGFDIAENMVSSANMTAKKLQMSGRFIATDILAIDKSYDQAFDYIFVTIGAITWFKDLEPFFAKVSGCLKDGGHLIMYEIHPLTNMLAVNGEENYDAAAPNKLVNSYFKSDPWVGNDGMAYMSDPAKEYHQTFYSYSHTMADILNAIIKSKMQIKKLAEFEHDASESFPEMSNQGMPLTYILVANKRGQGGSGC